MPMTFALILLIFPRESREVGMGLVGFVVVIALLIIFFVRDKKETAVVEEGAMPGVDRPWLVSDIMNHNSDYLAANATVRDAIAIMHQTETNGVPCLMNAKRWLASYLMVTF